MKIIGIYRCTDYGKAIGRRHVGQLMMFFLKSELVSLVWDTTGEDYGPPVVNDDDGVILSVQYF